MKRINNDAHIGSRVLLTHPLPEYRIGKANPVAGSMFECAGTVLFISEHYVSVMWDNGSTNAYMGEELSFAEEESNIVDIWEDM